MSDKDNFSFFGFPENNEIEIPDTTPPKNNTFKDPRNFLKDLSKMNLEELKKSLPKEALEELEEIAESQGAEIDDILKTSIESSQKLLSGNMSDLFSMFEEFLESLTDEEKSDDFDEEECVHAHYELGNIKYLKSEYFGSVECIEDDNLYNNFISKYGSDSTKYLDNNLGLKDFAYTDITAMLPLQNIKDLKFMEANNRFILFYAEPDIQNTYGFFVAIIKTENDYALYIPEFRNTFDIDSEGNVLLFNPVETPELFTVDPNGTASFDLLNIGSLEFAINFALAPKKKVLLSPNQFGIIKNTIPPILNDAMLLQVGTITSNESPEAILLKKDAELDLNERTFPLYFNFGRVIDKESLKEISQVLFKTNLNESKLLNNCELKYTSDHRLYIDIDLGDF